jgi:hypothetical protein
MKRRSFIRVAGGGVIWAARPAYAGLHSNIPEKAVAAWCHPRADMDIRERILSYAILAPSTHNIQPWLVDLQRPDEIMLYCDPTRLLLEKDPLCRQIMISHGTFLELLDMAAKEHGWKADIKLFPDGPFDPSEDTNPPIARIRMSEEPSIGKDPLYAQIMNRHTNRDDYTMTMPPRDVLNAIQERVEPFPVQVGFVREDQPELVRRHRALAREAWRIEMHTPTAMLESYKLLRIGPDAIIKHRDGITVTSRTARFMASTGLFNQDKAPRPGSMSMKRQIKDFNQTLDRTPSFFWLMTKGNKPVDQITAGHGYVRAQLAASGCGLFMQPLSQALQEYPGQAQVYKDVHQLLTASCPGYTVQMWTRLGFASQIGPAPRRGLADHLL